MKFTSCSKAYDVSSGPGTRRSAGTTTNRPPDSSPRHRSQNATSNEGDANCNTRLCEPTPKRSPCVATSLATPECDTTTPVGRRVDPAVELTYAALPGVIDTPGSSAEAAASAPSAKDVTTHTGDASASVKARRSAGRSGSSGR